MAGNGSRLTHLAEQWDSVSKQPMFKGGAVRIEKVKSDKIEAPEQQTAMIKKVESKHLNAKEVGDDHERQQHLGLWLGATYESVELLITVYEDIIPSVVHDMEISNGLEIMRRITQETLKVLEPHCKKYNASTKYGRRVAKDLIKGLFPHFDRDTNVYEALTLLLTLQIYYGTIEGHLAALTPAAAAMCDKEFVAAVGEATTNVGRMHAWCSGQIATRSPQTLVVPSRVLREELRMEEAIESNERGKA